MFRWREGPSPYARALLERERPVPAVPPATRARALVRARAVVTAGPVARAIPSSRGPLTIRWASAAGLVCVASVAAGAATYEVAIRAQPVTPPVAAAQADEPSTDSAGDDANPLPDRPVASSRAPAAAPRSRPVAAREELHLLERARAAVAREDFTAALPPLAEHARRFNNGYLTEEREALRVKALSGLGRAAEAHHAAVAFEARFPRSPLLSAFSQLRDSDP
jgi:hypothetical protein